MSEAKHTPIPWMYGFSDGSGKVEDDDDGGCITHALGTVIRGGNHDGIRTGVIREADAEFIVRACNSHDALLAQNKRLRDALDKLLKRHVALVECGDCGNWDVELEAEVIEARATLSETPEGGA